MSPRVFVRRRAAVLTRRRSCAPARRPRDPVPRTAGGGGSASGTQGRPPPSSTPELAHAHRPSHRSRRPWRPSVVAEFIAAHTWQGGPCWLLAPMGTSRPTACRDAWLRAADPGADPGSRWRRSRSAPTCPVPAVAAASPPPGGARGPRRPQVFSQFPRTRGLLSAPSTFAPTHSSCARISAMLVRVGAKPGSLQGLKQPHPCWSR